MKVVRDAGVDRLGTLPREHAGQSSNGPYRHLISGAEHKFPRKGSGRGAVPRNMQRADQGAQWACEKFSSYRARPRHTCYSKGGAQIISLYRNLSSKSKTAFLRER